MSFLHEFPFWVVNKATVHLSFSSRDIIIHSHTSLFSKILLTVPGPSWPLEKVEMSQA